MKKTLLLFLLLPFLGFAQLSGDYIISSTNSNPNFRTLALAVAQINSVGVSGPVKFLLDEDQTLTSLLSINQFNTTTTNTLTIKPNAGKTITINANMPNSSTGVPAVFRFNGASNIIIDGSNSTLNTKNLTLINNDNLSYTARAIIWIASNGATGSTNITIKNSNFRFSTRNQQLNLLSGVYSGSNAIGGNNTIDVQTNNGANSNISIVNNDMFNVKDGINVNGSSTAANSPSGWKIQGNKIGSTVTAEKPVRAIYLSYALNYEISGNTISGIRNTENQGNDGAAVILLGTSSGTISGNIINNIINEVHNNSYFTAGILSRSSGANSIINNIISNVYNTTTDSNNGNFYNKGNSIHIASGSSTNIYYNTIIGSGAPTGTAYASCLYISGGSGINIKSNIFVNTQSNKQYAIFNNGGTLGQISNNDYYVTNATNKFLNRINGTEYPGTGTTVPTNWNTAVSDSNSKIILPTFVSSTDYHLQDVTVNNDLTGIAISGVTTDIDGDARVKPYMGADEILKCIPTGDQTTFGNESWIGYVYKWTGNTAPNPATPTTTPDTSIATYIGTVTENKNFDRNVAEGAVSGVTTNISCETAPADRFFVRYKMTANITEAGSYNFMLGSDDGIRLYIDGTKVLERWNQHSYTVDSVLQNLTAGTHQFVLEYFEFDGSSRAAISFGLIKGDPTVYGDKVWNVYGYVKNDLNLANTVYAGNYVDPNLNVDSKTYWGVTKSPSAATIWQGAPMPDDNFTVSFKRRGFPCGQYQIQLVNSDDATQIYIDGNLVFTQSGYTNTATIINNPTTYALNSNSRVEIRLREDGGNANVAVNFLRVTTPYNGTGTPATNSSIVINSNTTLSSDVTVCSCTVNPNYTLTVPKDITLTVDEDITVGTGGKILVQDGGSLLQTSTSKTMFTGNTTAFEMQRKINARRYDLTYWSTPVNNPSFTLHDLSPDTLGDKYSYYDPIAGWTINYNGTMVMEPGKGYNVRAPQYYDIDTPSDFTAKFFGTPNNGDVSVTVTSGKWNLIGNPYPSAVDAKQFISNNNTGALYFWTHQTPPAKINGSNSYSYGSADFAAFTMLGGTRAASGGVEPSGYIAAGQSFFAKPSVSSVTFKNNYRINAKNTQFFKTNAKSSSNEQNRLWLNLSNTADAFKQLLIGYAEGATNSIDTNFDAVTIAGNTFVDFYSINESKKLTVQGRALPFDNSDIVPLGYKTTVATNFTISIDHADGLFDDQAVYLEDKTTGTITDLRKSNYSFDSAIGTFTDRFVLRYTSKTLGTDDFENSESGVLVSVQSKVIKVNSTTENIKEVQIYNIGGQLIYTKNKIDLNEFQISNLQSGNQVLLAKVILDNDHTVTKKIIFN
ncbi:T9SS sorting signal type C domain-containing protein [Flavobacterium sp. S87F.05.LMB.W.Kidney.N]|uniref:T9SS sorting signal type C domain-containing protein n=1 Tax=Flavobacterium sp. S87F.05.LMB.W.Kidney.N TaxID=1278758 RepID=UPI001064883C|nr:T9SS sorting signal type C domain-containing protein [Flavobacterium sp. S87F.05.LMB.W.Kidney.N]TDX08336.1 PA14 domain-containing protein [Flavobacterium sp. S87F.05.LMB.W.Kidney.N]